MYFFDIPHLLWASEQPYNVIRPSNEHNMIVYQHQEEVIIQGHCAEVGNYC